MLRREDIHSGDLDLGAWLQVAVVVPGDGSGAVDLRFPGPRAKVDCAGETSVRVRPCSPVRAPAARGRRESRGAPSRGTATRTRARRRA